VRLGDNFAGGIGGHWYSWYTVSAPNYSYLHYQGDRCSNYPNYPYCTKNPLYHTVPSGNRAKVTTHDAGSRALIDVEWCRQPTQTDIEHLARVLGLGPGAINLQVEDDGRRVRPIRLGARAVVSLEAAHPGAAPAWPAPSYAMYMDRSQLICLLKSVGFTFEEIRVIGANRLVGIPRDQLPDFLGWPLRFVETIRRRVTRKFETIRKSKLDPHLPEVLRLDPSRTALLLRFRAGGLCWELMRAENEPDVPGGRGSRPN